MVCENSNDDDNVVVVFVVMIFRSDREVHTPLADSDFCVASSIIRKRERFANEWREF